MLMTNLSADPMSKVDIRRVAEALRKILGLGVQDAFPMIKFYELILPRIDKNFNLQVVDEGELGGAYAKTYPLTREIILEDRVYDGITEGQEVGIHMFTAAHELGHYFLHTHERLSLNRDKGQSKRPAYMDPEWQADEFAGNLLVPEEAITPGITAGEIAERYKVSKAMARVRIERVLSNK